MSDRSGSRSAAGGVVATVLASVVLTSCVGGPPLTRALFSPIVPSPTLPNRDLPIVDAHNHLNGDMGGEALIRLMDASGVRRMVLMARYYRGEGDPPGSDEQAVAIARRHPGRFVPFVAGQRGELSRRSAWLNPHETGMLSAATLGLRSGEYFGLGEFILRHLPYVTADGQLGGELDIPIDTPLMRALLDVAARHTAPVLIHAEAEGRAVGEVETILRYQRGAPLIWAHSCGRAHPEVIRALLGRHPNLYCDLGGSMRAGRAAYGAFWPRQGPWMFPVEAPDGSLHPETRALWEGFPDRFLLGTDVAHTSYLRDYGTRIDRVRGWLAQLTPATARRLAYENAEALLLGRRSSSPR